MNIVEYADNLVLELYSKSDRRSWKVITTGEPDMFKIENGLSSFNSVVDVKYYTLREVKQLFIDQTIMGYEIRQNLLFKKGLRGVAEELAMLYRDQHPLPDGTIPGEPEEEVMEKHF